MGMRERRGSLGQYMADIIAVERRVEEALGQAQEQVKGYDEVVAALRGFQAMVKGHREALDARLQSLPTPVEEPGGGEGQTVSAALSSLCAVFSQAASTYAALHAVAHRFYDSSGEGNTADLAEKHLQNYAQALYATNQLVSDVVVRELGDSGEECQCQCPSCGLGICLCAPHGTITVNKAWRDALPAEPQGNLWVRPPRRNSVAARAGLRAGDVILVMDGEEILTAPDLQAAMRKRQPGERIQLSVQRGLGEAQNIALVR